MDKLAGKHLQYCFYNLAVVECRRAIKLGCGLKCTSYHQKEFI